MKLTTSDFLMVIGIGTLIMLGWDLLEVFINENVLKSNMVAILSVSLFFNLKNRSKKR